MNRNLRNPVVFLLLAFAALTLPHRTAASPEVTGIWQGQLGPYRIVFHVSQDSGGDLEAALDSPDQGATGIPADTVTVTGDTLMIVINAIPGSYQGVVQSADRISGAWTQMGRTMPLDLQRVEKAPEGPRRPQEPVRPYPYSEEEVTYLNESAGITFAGTLTLPPGDGPHPAALLITGSGPQDRDESIAGHKPFLVLADDLTRRGIATLRVDDRGVGGSTGSTPQSTTEDFASDALAGVQYLRSRPEVDGDRIGLVGHSEGALVGPMVAAQSSDVAFLVLLAPPGVPGREIVLRQNAVLLEKMGASKAFIDYNHGVTSEALELLSGDGSREQLETKIRTLHAQQWKDVPEAIKEERIRLGLPDPDQALKVALRSMVTPWYRSFIASDPATVLRQVSCPVLAVIGSKDTQVDPAINLPAVEEALQAGGNDNVTAVELEGLNHLFQTAETGSVFEYSKIEETFSPRALDVIGDWILARVAP